MLFAGVAAWCSPVQAQVTWQTPELIYAEGAQAYDNAAPGVDLATDHNGNAVSLWRENGTPAQKSVTLKSARSTDAGQTWSAPGNVAIPGEGKNVTDAEIAFAGSGKWLAVWAVEIENVAPYNTEIYYASSTNMGATWSAPSLITTQPSPHVAIHADGIRPMGIAAAPDGTVIVTYRSALLRSINAGSNWTYIPAQPTTFGGVGEFSMGARIAYAGGQNWYHAFDREVYSLGSLSSNRVYLSRSTDNGQTWSTPAIITNSESSNVTDLTAENSSVLVGFYTQFDAGPSNPQINAFTLLSSDTGQNWGTRQTLGTGQWTALHRNGTSAVALISESTRIAGASSTDGGAAWGSVSTRIDTPGRARDIVEVSPGVLLTAYDTFLDYSTQYPRRLMAAKSTDQGNSWTSSLIADSSSVPYDNATNFDVTVAANDAGRMIAVWRRENDFVRQIMLSRTDNFGDTWTPAQPIATYIKGTDGIGVASPRIFYAGNNVWVVGWVDSIFYGQTRSVDNGVTWDAPKVVQTDVWTYNIYGSDGNGTILGWASGPTQYYVRSDNYGAAIGYAAGADYGQAAVSLGGNKWLKIDDGVSYVSANNAQSWTAHAALTGLTDYQQVRIAASPDHQTVIVVAYGSTTAPTTVATFRSTDEGNTWSRTDLTVTDLSASAPISVNWWTNNTWLLSVGQGPAPAIPFLSEDNGATWSELTGAPISGVASALGRVVAVYTDFSGPSPQIMSSRASLSGFTAAQDWQLFE